MKNYTIKMPNRYYQGYGIIANLREYTKHLGSNCLIIISNNGFERYEGILEESLTNKGCDVKYMISCPEKSLEYVTDKEFVIGIGGGSIIDEAKMVANNSNIPCVIIPTVLSSDAACNSIIVPKKYGDKDTMIIRSNRNPEIVIADTKLLKESPTRYAIAGIGDALSTYIEALSSSLTTGYTMTHSDVPYYMLRLAEISFSSVCNNSLKAIHYMKSSDEKNLHNFEELVMNILHVSSILSENCGIALPHAFSLAFDEVVSDNKFLHGEKIIFGLLMQLIILEHWDHFYAILYLAEKLGLPCTLQDLQIFDGNIMMRISESICSNKLTKNVTGKEYEPIEIYNYMIKTNLKCK